MRLHITFEQELPADRAHNNIRQSDVLGDPVFQRNLRSCFGQLRRWERRSWGRLGFSLNYPDNTDYLLGVKLSHSLSSHLGMIIRHFTF